MRLLFLSICTLFIICTSLYAEDIRFPQDAGVVDLTQPPYNAKGDGVTDNTKAIQKAIDDYPNKNKILYLPNGTYVISDTLRWSEGDRGGMEQKRIILQGQSRNGVVLRLPDNCSGYDNLDSPKAMIWTGEKPAQRFRNALRNLTVSTGSGNPGTAAVQFMANNQGCMREITIRSEDGSGVIGLDTAYTDENGPCLIKNVKVEGFDTGIKIAHAVDSLVFENVELIGQKRFGLWNDGQCVSIRKLISRNAVPAVYNEGGVGLITLIDSDLEGTGDSKNTPAIINEAALLARNVTARNYQMGIKNTGGHGEDANELKVDEFISHPILSLFPSDKHTLSLPIQETPELEWEDPSEWVNPVQFGAVEGDEQDDTEAFQKAIDSGKKTVYIPNGHFTLDSELRVRGNVSRLIGCEAYLFGNGKIIVDEGSSPVVIIERIQQAYGADFVIEHAAKRTLVISSSIIGEFHGTGGGDIFFDDVCGGPFRFEKQNVWARQINPEQETTKIRNTGGNLWILGLKTERGHTLVDTIAGGKTEILGGFAYATSGDMTQPMFTCEDSQISVTLGESCFSGKPFQKLVKEKRGNDVGYLENDNAPDRTGGSMIPLFVSGRVAE